MKLFNLMDNALFLPYWRERMRSAYVISAVIIVLIVISLILINDYLTPKYIYPYLNAKGHIDYTRKEILPWLNKAFWDLAVLQGYLLLLFGSFSAYRMAIRERNSGTLDFHRSSPTPRIQQAIGLFFGTGCLEWCLYGGTMLISLFLTFISDVTITTFVKFYFSLTLSAVLFHVFAILLGLNMSKSTFFNKGIGGGIMLVVFVYLMLWGISTVFEFSSFYYMSWLPGYDALAEKLFMVSSHYSSKYHLKRQLLMNSFFAYRVSPNLFQVFVQIPLIVFGALGILRNISQPERPFFTKGQSALFSFFILFLFIGSMVNVMVYGGVYSGQSFYKLRELISQYIILLLFLGITGALLATPNQLLFLKGLRKARKLGNTRMDLNSDHSSNVLWLFSFCFVLLMTFIMVGLAFSSGLLIKTLLILIPLSQIVFFAQSWEYCQLGPYHRKRSYFWIGLTILWLIIPIFGYITKKLFTSPYYIEIMNSFSPVFSLTFISQHFVNFPDSTAISGICQLNTKQHQLPVPTTFLIIILILSLNIIAAIIASYFAAIERRKLVSSVLKK